VNLTVDRCNKETKRGTHGDGHGLYLMVQANGRKSWVYRYQINGLRRHVGLGGYPATGLALPFTHI
jgi:hypothetical protein